MITAGTCQRCGKDNQNTEVRSHWSHGTHGAVCVQSKESTQQVKNHNMKLISNKQLS
jgi:hypothetical protein